MEKVLRGTNAKCASLSRCAQICHLRRRLCTALDMMAVHHSARRLRHVRRLAALVGCLHAVSSLVVAFTARFGVKLLMRFASIRFYSHFVASRRNQVVHSMELCLVPEHSAPSKRRQTL